MRDGYVRSRDRLVLSIVRSKDRIIKHVPVSTRNVSSVKGEEEYEVMDHVDVPL